MKYFVHVLDLKSMYRLVSFEVSDLALAKQIVEMWFAENHASSDDFDFLRYDMAIYDYVTDTVLVFVGGEWRDSDTVNYSKMGGVCHVSR